MKKIVFMISISFWIFFSCESEPEVYVVEKFTPPEWIIGTWANPTKLLELKFDENDVQGKWILGDDDEFEDIIDIQSLERDTDNRKIKIYEAKNDDLYEIGHKYEYLAEDNNYYSYVRFYQFIKVEYNSIEYGGVIYFRQ